MSKPTLLNMAEQGARWASLSLPPTANWTPMLLMKVASGAVGIQVITEMLKPVTEDRLKVLIRDTLREVQAREAVFIAPGWAHWVIYDDELGVPIESIQPSHPDRKEILVFEYATEDSMTGGFCPVFRHPNCPPQLGPMSLREGLAVGGPVADALRVGIG